MSIQQDSPETRKLAAEIVLKGGLIAFRTDTFYGLGANPLDSEAVARIKIAKGSEESKPILLLVSDLAEIDSLVQSKPPLFETVKALWPGPLTIVMPANPNLPVEVTAHTGTVGVRFPDDDGLRSLVRVCGGRLTATSANLSGTAPAKSALEVETHFPGGIDLILDSGLVTVTKPSTVIDIVSEPIKLIREGAISKLELERVLGAKLV